jgi:hypothetical protein
MHVCVFALQSFDNKSAALKALLDSAVNYSCMLLFSVVIWANVL